MKKRILSLLLTLAMVLSVIPFAVLAETAENDPEKSEADTDTSTTADTDWYANETSTTLGDGDPTTLYIYNEADFVAFGAKLASAGDSKSLFDGCVIHIMADLDMSGCADWKTIIKRNRGFQGIIDGHNHTISNLVWTCETDNTGNTYAGLLGGHLKAGTNKNTEYNTYAGVFDLAFLNCSITNYATRTGGLFGNAVGECTIQNVYADIDVTHIAASTRTDSYSAMVGGLVGTVEANTTSLTIDSCVFAGTILMKGDNSYATGIGGFIGKVVSGGTGVTALKNNAFYGTVTMKENAFKAGFIGKVEGVSTATTFYIENCIAAGIINVTGTASSANIAYFAEADAKTTYRNNVYSTQQFVDSATSTVYTTLPNGLNSQRTHIANETDASSAYQTKTQQELKALTPTELQALGFTDMTPTTTGYPLPRVLVVNGIAPVAKADTAETPVTVLEGYQTTEVVDNKFNFRLVATVRFAENTTKADYQAVGFKIVANYGTTTLVKDHRTSTVYNSVSADNGATSYTAEALGGDYIFALACTGVPSDAGSITMEVTTYYETADGIVNGATEVFTVVPPKTDMSK